MVASSLYIIDVDLAYGYIFYIEQEIVLVFHHTVGQEINLHFALVCQTLSTTIQFVLNICKIGLKLTDKIRWFCLRSVSVRS